MKKTQYQNDLKDIRRISNTIRKGLNESCLFEDDYDELEGLDAEEAPVNEPAPVEQPEAQEQQVPQQPTDEPIETGEEVQTEIKDVKPEDEGMEELDKMGELDQIRKITLQGMTKLANQPEHPQFQALKKIFDMTNKAVEPKENNQQAQ